MRKGTVIAASIVGGLAATALVASAGFALATGINESRGQERDGGRSARQTMHNGQAMHNGQTMHNGQSMRNGQGQSAEMAAGLTAVSSGTLTSEQRAALASMAEEEKVAHDLYIAFGDLYGDSVFDRIANAETRHLGAVQTLLDRYQLPDPTAGETAGQFSSESMQQLYDSLLAQGSTDRDAAYAAARLVEETDIADLTAAKAGLTAPDVRAVYDRLLTGSQHHLSAFGG